MHSKLPLAIVLVETDADWLIICHFLTVSRVTHTLALWPMR